MALNLWTGAEGGACGFVLSVDGVEVARETLEAGSGEFVDKEYRLPEQVTAGKQTVRVKLQAPEGLPLAAVDTVRLLRR